ncbi:MAG: UDP-2,3-diacylglucosamine diphosphatase [Thermodesulfobacteriota bacterium]
MKAVFIADSHIKGLDDPNQSSLCRFLDTVEPPDMLVIVGDLFDAWTGFNHAVFYRYFPLLMSLSRLRERGTEIVYVEGNHDFTMGEFFTGFLGAKVYPDTCELDLDGKRVLVAHGDTAEKDIWYTLWRGCLRLFIRAISFSPSLVWNIGGWISRKTRTYSPDRAAAIEGRQRAFARRRIRGGLDGVILAHSHKQAFHREETEGKEGFYANPGAWTAGSMDYLVYEDGEFRLERYRPEEEKTPLKAAR